MTHEFYRIVVTGLFGGRWKCAHCGIKLANTDDARLLEGRPCR